MIRFVALTCCITTFTSGCALVNGTTQKVSINTSEPGAQVYVDGEPKGKTGEGRPIVIAMSRKETHVVTATKEGYASNQVMVNKDLSGLGVLDLIGTCLFLVPGISLIMGSAWDLTPSSVFVPLDEKK
jgi:hypothetical protein